MKFYAKLNLRFYVAAFFLLVLVLIGWYGIYFLNANQILMEDNTPMDAGTKLIFSGILGVVVASWTVSLLAMLRQMVRGYAFSMDSGGIYKTVTFWQVLAFVFVIPVKEIPRDAIESFSDNKETGAVELSINKSKLDVSSILRPFASKKYRLFAGFTKESPREIKVQFHKYNARG